MDSVFCYKRYPFKGILNFRDLGGYPVWGGGMTRYGVFYRCGHLCTAAREDIAALRKMGMQKIIDLRNPGDLVYMPDKIGEEDGIRVVNIPLQEEIHPEELGVLPGEKDTLTLRRLYQQIVDKSGSRILRVLQELADTEGSAAFHCFNGKDRTGIIALFLLALAGVEDCDIVADFEVSHTYIEGHTEDVSGSNYENMRWLLAYIGRQFGSPVQYLRRQGLTPDLEKRLVDRLVQRPEG